MTPEQRKDVNSMTRAAGIKPILTSAVHATHPLLGELAGPAAPTRRIAPQTPQARPATSNARSPRSNPAAPTRSAHPNSAGRSRGRHRAR